MVGRVQRFLSRTFPWPQGGLNAIISRNQTIAVRYLASATSHRDKRLFSPNTRTQGILPNVYVQLFVFVCLAPGPVTVIHPVLADISTGPNTVINRGEHPVVTGTLDTLTKKLDLPLRHTRWPWLPLRACRLLRRFEPADEAGCAALACYPRQHTRGRVFRAARPRRQRFCSISSAPNVDGEGQQVRSCP